MMDQAIILFEAKLVVITNNKYQVEFLSAEITNIYLIFKLEYTRSFFAMAPNKVNFQDFVKRKISSWSLYII